ncbi:MAG: ribosome assembly factor SBDS [Methanomassiliicoccaceae archaeon]|jgi:ribosome maturation protein SDO1|nr:ribosome assembly factor SBDS [Methanomassiliicoccaceae archaeon]
MVSLDDAVVARLESHGETFEILLDPNIVKYLKDGRDLNIADHLAAETVFKNASKGTRSAEDKIKEVFGTDDIGTIAKVIISKGDIQVTAEQRKEMLEAKRNRITAYIARNAINPQTKTPHPLVRIELALAEAKFHVDPFKSVEQQVDEAMRLLRPLIPIKFEKSKIAVKLRADDYGRCFDDLAHYGIVEREEWQPDGSWIGLMEIPAGVITELTSKLNDRTRGHASVKLL